MPGFDRTGPEGKTIVEFDDKLEISTILKGIWKKLEDFNVL